MILEVFPNLKYSVILCNSISTRAGGRALLANRISGGSWEKPLNPSSVRCFLQKHFYIHIKTPHGTTSAWWVFQWNNPRSKLIHFDFLHSLKHFKDSNESWDISLFPLVYYNALTAVRSCHSNKVVSVFMNWNVYPGFPFWEIQISISESSIWKRNKRFPILNSLLGKHLLFQTGQIDMKNSQFHPKCHPQSIECSFCASVLTAEGLAWPQRANLP